MGLPQLLLTGTVRRWSEDILTLPAGANRSWSGTISRSPSSPKAGSCMAVPVRKSSGTSQACWLLSTGHRAALSLQGFYGQSDS